MAIIEFADRAVPAVVRHYVETRRASSPAISTATALRAIRTVLPNCPLSDRELVDLIAVAAIRQGRNIDFDQPH